MGKKIGISIYGVQYTVFACVCSTWLSTIPAFGTEVNTRARMLGLDINSQKGRAWSSFSACPLLFLRFGVPRHEMSK